VVSPFDFCVCAHCFLFPKVNLKNRKAHGEGSRECAQCSAALLGFAEFPLVINIVHAQGEVSAKQRPLT
jgi:hypothetical protein